MDQENFDDKVKTFFKDKKNTAIVILSTLVLIFGGVAFQDVKTIEASSTTVNLDERIESDRRCNNYVFNIDSELGF